MNIAIKLESISKSYFLKQSRPTLLNKIISNRNSNNKFQALENINSTIFKGEFVGIIGRNGAGKTTLLKIISDIIQPTSGKITTFGSVASLINLDGGFLPEFNGIENIKMNGMLLGMTNAKIKKNLKSIIQYADIGEFVHEPLFTYSTGMRLRLGFATLIHSDFDILLLDELTSVGDVNFKKKANHTLKKLLQTGKTIIIVSQSLKDVGESCNRIIWLGKGKLKLDDKADIVINAFNKETQAYYRQ